MAKVPEHDGGRFEMLHKVKTTNLIIKRTPLLFGLLFAAVLALLPISAGAQCSTGWDASGQWNILAQGEGLITLKLEQNGQVLSGKATVRRVVITSVYPPKSELQDITARVDGTIDDSFSVQ